MNDRSVICPLSWTTNHGVTAARGHVTLDMQNKVFTAETASDLRDCGACNYPTAAAAQRKNRRESEDTQ